VSRASSDPAGLVVRGAAAILALCGVVFACSSERRAPERPLYAEVKELFDARCVRCHADSAPAAGFRAGRYVDLIGCTADGRSNADAIPGALARPDHVGLLSGDERDRILAWLRAGAPSVLGGAHPTGYGHPRSAESHTAALRADRYRALLEPEHPDRCARCHEGLGAGTRAAPGATPCTSCHTEPGFPFACATCHGPNGTSARNTCFYDDARADRTHRVHVGPNASRATGIACASCHPVPTDGRPGAFHGNGYADIAFDGVIGTDPHFDRATKRCTGTCHARGGARPVVAWNDPPVGCNDCHRTPPEAHFPPPCTSCHAEASADGTALIAPVGHINGAIDATGPPTSGAHRAHLAPANAVAVPCETCHALPFTPGPIAVRLGGLAVKGGRRASFDPVSKTCSGTYCHEGAGGSLSLPTWTTGPAAAACGACHSSPPPPPHPAAADCGAATCHGGITSGSNAITTAGRAVHVNGVIDRDVR
jgi:predicted CxxxxCH...CXXCH cytochrome family protein